MTRRLLNQPMTGTLPPSKGRGAVSNRTGRFEAWQREPADDGWDSEEPGAAGPPTHLIRDSSRSIISYNDSPDVPFDRSINPYRGCEHGCVYCYARPSHAYLGLSPGLDFESRILFKPEAHELLRAELARDSYRCATVALGANTDPYQPAERKLGITRRVLEVLAECHHPVGITTKSALAERDLDILTEMAREHLVEVRVSITTMDSTLARRMEPRAASPRRRLETIRRLHEAGIPLALLFAPVIPCLNDGEMEAVLEQGWEAGCRSASYVLLRLPLEIKDLFQEWLATHYPLKAQRVLNRVRDTREGGLYDSRFGSRMAGTGEYAKLIGKRFRIACRRQGYGAPAELDISRFVPPPPRSGQLPLF